MELGIIIVLCVLIFVIYALYLRPYLLARTKFKCQRCGQCCRLRVKLYPRDIKRLNKAGKTGFMTFLGNLKRKNGYCIFLRFKNGKASCSVYKSRPDICRKYPVSRGLFGKRMDFRCKSFSGRIG